MSFDKSKRKHFIFLTNEYLPKPGATGLCVSKVAGSLASKGHKVDVLCYQDGFPLDVVDDVRVTKIKVPYFYTLMYGNGFGNSILRKFVKKIARYHSLLSSLINIRNYPIRSTTVVDRFVKNVKNLVKKGEKIIVVASFTPLEAVAAAAKVKKWNQNIKIVYYSLDSLSNTLGNFGILPVNYRLKKGIETEKKYFDLFDKIIVMECHRDHYFSDVFSSFWNKFVVAGFPLLEHKNIGICGESLFRVGECKNIVFAGTLYRGLRDPSYTCALLNSVSKSVNIRCFFLGGGNCQEILNGYKNDNPDVFEIMGMQPHSLAERYINDADILLSIGNRESPLAPSKIYEYMATGKPIIHVYSYDADPCLAPLRKYKNAILIKENGIGVERKVVGFLANSRKLEFSLVECMFESSTPRYTANLIDF